MYSIIDIIFYETTDKTMRLIDCILANIYKTFVELCNRSNPLKTDPFVVTYVVNTGKETNVIDHCRTLINFKEEFDGQCRISKITFILICLARSTIIPILFSTQNELTSKYGPVHQSSILEYRESIIKELRRLEEGTITQDHFVENCRSCWTY